MINGEFSFRLQRDESSFFNRLGRLRRALKFAAPYKHQIIIISVLTVVIACVNAIEPLYLKFIFDDLEQRKPLKVFFNVLLFLVFLGFMREVPTAISNWLTWHTRLGIHHTLLDATVERLHRMPLSFHGNEGVGAIMTRLDRSIQGFIEALGQVLFHIFPAILYLAFSLVVMFKLNWQLALLVLFFSPGPILIAALATPEQTRRESELLNRWSRIYSRFNEVLSGITTVKSFAMEDSEKSRFLSEVRDANLLVARGVRIDSGFMAASNLVILVARLAAIGLGGYLILQGRITTGTLIAFLGYIGGLFGPLQGLSSVYQTIEKASVSLDGIFSILDFQERLGDATDALTLHEVKGNVLFENVKFSYGVDHRPTLKGIQLQVRQGETLAIVGPSGSGKTTLMSLLMRFYDPTEGLIRLDGLDLRNIRQKSLRQNIGVILQDPLLFNDTIRNNIAYGLPMANLEKIAAAARAANAEDFIENMPDRYETVVGERGGRLSVGERQRISIARALIKNAPIIILDEATSSLDAESEALVQDALRSLMKGRTTFVIAHRLSTVVDADRIIVLKDGVISESGTHVELLRLGGYYAMLVRRQTRGLIINEGE